MKRTAKMLLPAMAVLAGCAGTDSYLASRSNMAGMPPVFDMETTAGTRAVAGDVTDALSQNTKRIDHDTPPTTGEIRPR